MQPTWELINQVRTGLSRIYGEALNVYLEQNALADLPVGMLIHAYDLHPEPISAQRVQACVPHYDISAFQPRIEILANAGMLKARTTIDYDLTPVGLEQGHAIYQAIYQAVTDAELLSEQELNWLAATLDGIVQQSVNSLNYTPAADLADQGERMHGQPPMVQIMTAIEVLVSFRMDAHQAAYQPFEMPAPAWELLTLVWRESLRTVSAIMDHLTREFPRGYTADDYQHYAAQLIQRGWLACVNGEFHLTAAGRSIREDVEDSTDLLFFKGWHGIDLERLHALLSLLNERIKRLTPA